MKKDRTCYLMVKDVPGQEDEAALEFGIDLGLEEGEKLPEDVEELTEAQFTVFKMLKILRGTFEEAEAASLKGDKGSGLIVPS